MIRAGELRQRITIQQSSASRTNSGGKTYSWSTYATLWAKYESLQGGEYYASQQETGESAGRFKCRYYSGVTTDMRVSWSSQTYDIERVDSVDARDIAMYLYVREVVD